jgi:cbb3-type cytochrome oxidase subunit 3
MDYVWFVLFILFLALILFVLNKMDRINKNKHREAAYTLLETVDPDPKEIRDTIKGLRLYGGRLRKNQEFMKLIRQLQDKLASIQGG